MIKFGKKVRRMYYSSEAQILCLYECYKERKVIAFAEKLLKSTYYDGSKFRANGA